MKSITKLQLATIALALGSGNIIYALIKGSSLESPIERTFFQWVGFATLWLILPKTEPNEKAVQPRERK